MKRIFLYSVINILLFSLMINVILSLKDIWIFFILLGLTVSFMTYFDKIYKYLSKITFDHFKMLSYLILNILLLIAIFYLWRVM